MPIYATKHAGPKGIAGPDSPKPGQSLDAVPIATDQISQPSRVRSRVRFRFRLRLMSRIRIRFRVSVRDRFRFRGQV